MIQFKWKECYGCSSPTRCEAEKTCYIIAPRATEAGEDGKIADSLDEWARHAPASEMCDVMHKAAIALRTRPLSSRPAIIEECARVCRKISLKHFNSGRDNADGSGVGESCGADECEAAIRALAPREQNAAPHPYTRGDINNDACQICGVPELRHATGPAVAAPQCEELADRLEAKSEWWGNQGTGALLLEAANALRAAPSLTHDFDLLQTLRLRCNYIINGYSDAKLEAKEMGRLIGEALRAKVREHAERERK